VVAAVRGPAVGIGFSLAMACDVVIASAKSNFSQIFTKVGLAPDGGAIWFLARQMGITQAKELVYSARRLGGDEAHALGLVTRPGRGRARLRRGAGTRDALCRGSRASRLPWPSRCSPPACHPAWSSSSRWNC
jgi:enoyl-CoA hydratase/carnithine racemase